MSNKNSKGFMGIFKKSPKRESEHPDVDLRRSRDFGTLEPMSLRPKEDRMEPEPDLESKRQQEEKAELQRLQRQEQLERQRTAKERQRIKVQERERERQRNMQRKKELVERQRNLGAGSQKTLGAERQNILGVESQKTLGLKRQNILEPKGSLMCAKVSPRPSEFCVDDANDDEFKRDIENLENQVGDLDFRSKMMATLWMNRLRAPVQCKEEAMARNIITAHLLKCHKENVFNKEPFSQPPTSDNLETIREKMSLTRDTLCNDLTLENQRETNTYINQLFHDSYDGGEFLSQLPVPRDGTFFILHMRPNL